MSRRAILKALVAAILFGIATPFSKALLAGLGANELAGLLYLGAAAALLPAMIGRHRAGVCAPSLRPAESTSPRRCYRGRRHRRTGAPARRPRTRARRVGVDVAQPRDDGDGGAGGAVLPRVPRPPGVDRERGRRARGRARERGERGGRASSASCSSAARPWRGGLDNNLTALIDGISPEASTFWKGLVAGTTNLAIGIALFVGARPETMWSGALLVGAVSYGASIRSLHRGGAGRRGDACRR